jgi:hypothetical protein
MEEDKYKEILRGNFNKETFTRGSDYDLSCFFEKLKEILRGTSTINTDSEDNTTKVVFEYTKTKAGNKIHMKCSNSSDSPVSYKDYSECFKAILKYIVDNCL